MKQELHDCEHLYKHFVYYPIKSDEEAYAAIAAYCTADGTIGYMSSSNEKLQGAFYSKYKQDLDEINVYLYKLFPKYKQTVRLKKSTSGHDDGYQLQISNSICQDLLSYGVPIGRKVDTHFLVPEAVLKGSDAVVKSYLSALWAAEGTTPTDDHSGKTRMPKRPVLSMCKTDEDSLREYFVQLQDLSQKAGIESTVTVNRVSSFDKPYYAACLNIKTNANNLVRFYEYTDYRFCQKKALLGWTWLNYLNSYVYASEYRYNTVLDGVRNGETYTEIGSKLGLTRGGASRIYSSIRKGKTVRAGKNFLFYPDWLKDRFDPTDNSLKLAVVQKFNLPGADVFNIKVDSPDHSYLLANGINNFNSFETMLGRVYYAFDREETIREDIEDLGGDVWVGLDFNVGKMCAAIGNKVADEFHVFDEIVIEDSNTREMCQEIKDRYPNRKVTIFPDPSGKSRKSSANIGQTDLTIIKEDFGFRCISPAKAPPVVDRVNDVNSLLRNANGVRKLFVHTSCQEVIKCLDGQTYKEDTNQPDKTQNLDHMCDALGYLVTSQFSIRKRHVREFTLHTIY